MELLTDGWTKKQVVGQAELVPCLAAKQVWRKRMRGRLVMNYIDNEAAKYALIKGTSPTRDSVAGQRVLEVGGADGVVLLAGEGPLCQQLRGRPVQGSQRSAGSGPKGGPSQPPRAVRARPG